MSKDSGSDKSILSSSLWAYGSQIGYILIGLLGNIFLARLLNPGDFGAIGIAMFFVSIANVFVESGLGGAIIRKIDATNKDYNTMFIFNLIVSVIIFILMITFSGLIADYYKIKSLDTVLIALSLMILINALSIVQRTRLTKNMQFKSLGIHRLIAISVATIISIIVAKEGFGVWSIVALQLINSSIFTISLWVKGGAQGKMEFDRASFKEMFSFGMYTTGSSLLITLFDNIYQLVIGRFFNVSQVGYFYQAKRLQDSLDAPSKNVVYGAIYSHLSKFQHNKGSFYKEHIRIAKVFAILISLVTILVHVLSKDVVVLLYSKKWLESAPYLQALTIVSLFAVIETIFSNVFRIYNKVNTSFNIEILKKVFQFVTIGVGVYFNNINVLLSGFILSSIFGFLLIFIVSSRIVERSAFEFIKIFLLILCAASISWFGLRFTILKFDNVGFIYKLLLVIPFTVSYFLLLLCFGVFKVKGKKIIF